ncbi:autotransporter outer membrane beta-barrel domain-containing protein [Selenomonas infelix]|nr:autotransporter outer membrane beta-barrel domain-containing protein [Selenomonas infelix]
MQFDLGSGINSGDQMLEVYNQGQTFDWNNISVKGLRAWANALAANNVNTPTLTLYSGANLTLNNYAPTIVGTRGDYEFGKRSDASGTGTVTATTLSVDGNRFQKATETPTASAAEAHAGISTYGNTTNHNTLNLKDNGGTPVDITDARAGYTNALNGGSKDNTLNLLTGGSVTNGYAGYTTGVHLLANPEDENHPELVDTTKNADAKNNTVNIKGGTLNAGGKLYGGYIAPNAALTPPNNVSAGNASDNTINIENGTFDGNNEIYGGYTNGTGKATGNTVNLGKSDGTLVSTTLSNVFIYGGAASGTTNDVFSDNLLNVNAKGITARGIQNFGKVKFNLGGMGTIARTDTLLTLSGGATTGIDWAGVEVNTNNHTFTPSTYEKHLFTAMHNSAGINFMKGTTDTYAPLGAKEKIVGDLEYAMDRDSSGQNVNVEGYQFRNHTAAYSEATHHTDAWAGRTASGQTVTNNKLTFTGNATNAYGGLVENKKHNSDGTYQTAGSATKNTLDVTGGTLANAYGAKVTAKNGSANENNVNIASSVTGAVYGAELTGTGTGDATKSTVKITAGTVGGNVYGGKVAGTGAATGHTINLYGGSVGGSVYGGHTASGATTGNTVNLGSGTTNSATTVTGTIYGGNQGADTNNVLNVNTNATAGNIANFGMVKFNFNSTFNQANPMLNLVGGAVTNLDWNKFKHTGNAPSGTSVLMQNMTGIHVSHYHGAREISSTGTHEYTIDTDTNTSVAKQILFGGYQFKDANVTPTTSDPAKDIWAGRSVIGNTTTNNILTINGTNHRDAYGGWTAGTGTTAPAKFNSTSNTVNLKAGSVRNIYGGFTSVQSGSATGNNVNISGGSVSGTVHGGYLSHASATGDATGNTITITGGTMADVYGGFTAGTGATTGNTVNLGSAANAVASGTTIGTIYGGNKSAATDNTLNVYDSATARNIANFDKINFKATSTHITVGDTLLTLTTGATNFDWNKLHVDNLDNLNSSATSDRILTLMHNSNNINLSNYTPTGTRGRIHTNDYEADIATDGNSATTQNVYLKGYRFQNNTTNYAGGTATDAWGGRSIIGNKVQKNKLTLTGGSATLNARGGMVENTTVPGTTGDAAENKLILNTGAQTANAYGAEVKTKTGSATKNEVTINAGTVHGNVYGAALTHAAATGSATDNTVTFAGGSVTGNVYGGHTVGTGSVTGSNILLGGGSVGGDVYGGFTNGSGATTGNTVSLGNGTNSSVTNVTGTIYGGNKTTDTGNTLNVNTNATAGNIKNFENLKFSINSNALNAANPMLTLNAGTATNNLDWGKLTVDATKFNSPISTYEAYNLTLMRNVNGIDFNKNSVNTYSANGGIKSVTSGNFEFSIDTLGSSVHTTEVRAAGYQYKNHTGATYTAGDGTHNAAWAGRTAVGNKVENNKLTVTGGTINVAAYGGLVENHKLDAHGNPLPTGDAEKNTVVVASGNVANAYGAEVRTKNGNATENTAEITNGTVGSVYGASLAAANAAGTADKSKVTIAGGTVNGAVYGGHIANAAATGQIKNSEVNIKGGSVGGTVYGGYNSGSGDATGATVNITGGTLHDVYGGHANGTGKSTGNTVNLGTATTAFTATSVGTVYGGNKTGAAGIAGNTLNVNSRSARATDVKNFENVNFDVAHNVSHGDTMLTLTSGAGTTIDWSKMKLKNLDTITASPTTDRILTLIDSTSNITFTNYNPVRAREAKTDGDYEYVLNTDNETATAKKVNVTGYRFRNNHPTYSAGSATEAWGGRSKIGNKVEKNSLKVTGGSITTAAYGGIAQNLEAGDGVDGYKKTGDAAENKLILEGGTVKHGYGADVRTEAGNATKNTIDLKGAAVSDNLYGGALTHASASGAATGNTVNLLSGSVGGSVYGGFANHNGTTTGNTIAIGDGTNNAAVTVTGDLVGGNKAATGNILDIKSKGAQVGSLKNFGTIKFNLGPSVADGDTVLTLNRDTTLTYSTIEKPTGTTVSTWLGNVMEKNVHLFQMAAGKTLTLNGYTPATGSERSGDVEYSLVTNNNQAATTGGSLDLSAYKWQNANVEVNSGAHANVFGGKTVYQTDGKTLHNKLTLKAGANVTNAIGGDTQTTNGTAEDNTLKVEAGTATNAYGAKTKHGKAYKNQAIAAGGTVTNLVGAKSTNGAAEKNDALISGGTVTNAYGAETLVGDATENSAVITAGSVTGSLKGAQSAGKALKNTVEIKGGTISGAKVMGAEAAGNAEKNTVTITNTPTSNAAAEIVGGRSTGGDAIENVVNVNASITGDVYGGRAHNASLRNTVNIADGVTVTGNVFGGACVIAKDNQIYVGKGSTVTGNVTGGSAPTSDGNTIHLTGSTVGGNVIGGTGLAANGNTLAIHHDSAHPTSHINDFTGIKKLHFYLSEGIETNNPTLLKLGVTNKSLANIDVGLGVHGRARALKVNDVISLMKVAGNGTLSDIPTDNKVTGMQGVSLLYEFAFKKRNTDELIATVTKAAISDQTKSFVETRAAATDFINRGANLLAGPGIASAKKEAAVGKQENEIRGYHLWAAMDQGSVDTKTGSYAETKGYNLSLGWARELKGKSATLIVTPFVEYGKGKYDAYLDDGTHGSGNISYFGAGIMGRMETLKGLWAEAALHGGKVSSDYSGSVYTGSTSRYDSSNAYYAAHLGIGKEVKTNDKDKLNTYLRYFWSYQSGMQTDIHSSGSSMSTDDYDFSAVNSNRMRLGFTYTHKDSEKSEVYAGLAWEYEFSGKAGASYQGYDTPSPSLRGGSAMIEAGYRFAPQGSRFSYDLHFTGWLGSRHGYTGGAHVNWAF